MKEKIELCDLPDHIRHREQREAQSVFEPGMTLEEMEREAIRRTLEATGGHRAETSRRLGLSVRTLQRKIKEYRLEVK